MEDLMHKRQAGRRAAAGASRVAVRGSSVIGDRPTQQDAIMMPGEPVSEELLAERGHLCVLCDGMGGLEGGEAAGRICADMIIRSYYESSCEEPVGFYRTILPAADQRIAKLTDSGGLQLRCGTTVSSAVIRGRRLYWACVGDSRVYLYSRGKLRRLSRDHNHLMRLREQYEAGALSEIEMLTDPRRNALISYIGMGGVELMDVHAEDTPLFKGDMVLLCSDGLYHALRDAEIEKALGEKGAFEKLPEKLTRLASERDWMLHDNISVVVMKYF